MKTVVACDGKEFKLECDSGTIIHIISAMYGRRDGSTCPPAVPEPPMTYGYNGCQEKDGLKFIQSRCEAAYSCGFTVNEDLFGTDWCMHMKDKYLDVTYGCVKGRSRSNNITILFRY